MIYVTALDGTKVEPLTQVGDFKMEQNSDGKLTLSMKCYPNTFNPGYKLLTSESLITAFGYDFKVHQFNEGVFKTITATSTFFNLSKIRKMDILGGTATLRSRISWCLEGTGWTASFDPDVENISEFIENFGNDNIVTLVEKVLEVYNVEYIIMPNMAVHFARKVGGDNDYQYRYKHNVSDVKLVEDTTELYTVVRGTGKNGIEATYISPNASVFGALEAAPLTNEEMETEEALLQWLSKQITDVPKISIESTVPELTNRTTGETVWLIYEPMDLVIQTRITKQTKKIINGELITSSVTFGNIVPKNYVDLFVERVIKMDENDKLYRSRIEQTNRYIILEVERIDESVGRIEIYADEIKQSVTDLRTDAFAAITINSDQIRSEVQSAITTVNQTINNKETAITSAYRSEIQQSAQSVLTTVTGMVSEVSDDVSTVSTRVSSLNVALNNVTTTVSNQTTTINSQGSRLSTAEAKISVQASEISQTVRKDQVMSAISQTPETIKMSASKINFSGAVFGDSTATFKGDINTSSNITVGNNLYLGSQSSSAEKTLYFNNGANITGGTGDIGRGIELNCQSLDVNQATFINLNESAINSGYVKSMTNGLEITRNSGDLTKLAVKVNGTFIGDIKML